MRKNVVKKDEKRIVLRKTTPTLSRYYMAWEIQKGGGRNPENVVIIVKERPKWENSRYRGDKGEKQILY